MMKLALLSSPLLRRGPARRRRRLRRCYPRDRADRICSNVRRPRCTVAGGGRGPTSSFSSRRRATLPLVGSSGWWAPRLGRVLINWRLLAMAGQVRFTPESGHRRMAAGPCRPYPP